LHGLAVGGTACSLASASSSSAAAANAIQRTPSRKLVHTARGAAPSPRTRKQRGATDAGGCVVGGISLAGVRTRTCKLRFRCIRICLFATLAVQHACTLLFAHAYTDTH
jgi:hypothetical protein